MLKTLSESGLAEYVPYEGARLTDAGRMLALRVLRRHRLIELFLVRTLEPELGRSARRSREHGARGQRSADRPDRRLSGLSGDRSARRPDSQGRRHRRGLHRPPAVATRRRRSGSAWSRVLEQSPEFLRYLTETGLKLDAEGTVIANRAESGTITVEVAGQQTTLAHDVADRLLVT